MPSRTVHLVSLGCPKNLVDSEVVLGSLVKEGWVPVENPEDAELIVINTCSFIEPATEESIETILQHAVYKEAGACRRLVVTGCLAQRYGTELARELPEVDAFWGTGELSTFGEEINARELSRWNVSRPGFLHDENSPRVHSRFSHSVFLKISEGCDRHCTFCVIPKIRGKLRSRPLVSLLEEARRLVDEGAREISLVAQDSTAYGQDRKGREDLQVLLEALVQLPHLSWIRLHYLHPASLTESMLRLLAAEPKICSYLDLPLQHASTSILRAMGRGVDARFQRELLERIRSLVPGVSIRTTFMVGFPGETDRDFRELLAMAEEQRFERMGVFTYSCEDGTPAARMAGHLPESVKQERARILTNLQAGISLEHHKALQGRVVPVMIDGVSDQSEFLLEGRMESQAPDIDGKVFVSSAPGDISPGTIHAIKIEQVTEVDLAGSWCP